MDQAVDCSVGFMKNAMGSSSFTNNDTTIYCHVNILPDIAQRVGAVSCIEVHWNEGTSWSRNKYFADIVGHIFNKIVRDDLRRTFVLELWVCAGVRNALMCAFNAAALALIDAGVPLGKMVYAAAFDEQKEGVVLFEDDRSVFVHSFGEVDEHGIKSAENKLTGIRDIMRFRLESKCDFNLQ